MKSTLWRLRIRARRAPWISASLLALLTLWSAPSIAGSVESCKVEQAQRLLESRPRPDGEIDALLAGCRAAGSTDWRVPMIEAIRARAGDDLDRTVVLLEEADRLAPGQPNIRGELTYSLTLRADRRSRGGDSAGAEADLARANALEPANVLAGVALGNLLEQRGQYDRAKALYAAALAAAPKERTALLGAARIAREERRWSNADDIYVQLLEADPNDLEARAGRGFVEIGRNQIAQARRTFTALAAQAPDSQDVRTGLANARNITRYQLDIAAGLARTDDGEAWSAHVGLRANLDERHQITLGYTHYSRELPVAGAFSIATPLPSNAVHAGLAVSQPQSHSIGVSYDLRLRGDLPTEHWLGLEGGIYVARGVQLTGALRQGFGDRIWENRYVRAGVAVDVAEGWRVGGNAWFEHYKIGAERNAVTYSGSVQHFIFGDGLVEFGAGYNPQLDNVNVHGRAVLPIGRGALLLTGERATINGTLLLTAGWRLRW